MLPLPVAAAAIVSGVALWFEHESIAIVIAAGIAIGALTVWFKRLVWAEIRSRNGPAVRAMIAFFLIYSATAILLVWVAYWLTARLIPHSS